MKKLILTIAFMAVSILGYAQLDLLRVEITDGIENSQLKSEIENNLSSMLQAFNRAIIEGKNPKLKKTYLLI